MHHTPIMNEDLALRTKGPLKLYFARPRRSPSPSAELGSKNHHLALLYLLHSAVLALSWFLRDCVPSHQVISLLLSVSPLMRRIDSQPPAEPGVPPSRISPDSQSGDPAPCPAMNAACSSRAQGSQRCAGDTAPLSRLRLLCCRMRLRRRPPSCPRRLRDRRGQEPQSAHCRRPLLRDHSRRLAMIQSRAGMEMAQLVTWLVRDAGRP